MAIKLSSHLLPYFPTIILDLFLRSFQQSLLYNFFMYNIFYKLFLNINLRIIWSKLQLPYFTYYPYLVKQPSLNRARRLIGKFL